MLLYFFRKKIAFCNYYGLYTILGLYAVTFVRMALPFEFKFTYTFSDYNVYASIMNVLTPDKGAGLFLNSHCSIYLCQYGLSEV